MTLNVVFIGTDTNLNQGWSAKISVVTSEGKMYLSTGIHVEDGKSVFECNWRPKTPEARKDARGYGPDERFIYLNCYGERDFHCFFNVTSPPQEPGIKKIQKILQRRYDGDFMTLKNEMLD